MTAVPCSECKSHFFDITSFHLHFQISHQNKKNYVCKVSECNRSYDRYASFRNHLINVHNIPVVAVKAPVVSAPCNMEVEDIDSSADVTSNVSHDSNNVVSSDASSQGVNVKDLFLLQEDYFVSKLYSNPAFPRNLVDSMINEVSNFLSSPFFENMRNTVTSSLDPSLDPKSKENINQMFEFVMNPFEHLSTEFKRFEYFKDLGEYIPPESYDIFVREERVGNAFRMKKVTGQFIPLRKVLTKFFYLPHALEDTISYMSSLSSEVGWYSNIIQGSVWQRKISKFKPDDTVFPLNLYYDEVEPNSALGPHCEPLGCTYIQIATLPPEWNSRLDNIFLALLFDADNRSVYGNRRAFKPLISELIFLEKEGIEVETVEKGKVRIYFVVSCLLGDNKALNEICGYVGGFTAHFYCRICKCFREDAYHMCEEDESLLRTPENYAADVESNDPSATGVKEECVFNDIPSFSAPTDIGVDEFHDLTEGVAHYTMVAVLKHFDRLNNMFLTTLNGRMYTYDYGIDNDNRPPLINADRLRGKIKLKMTGAEMTLFVRVFGVLVKDLVPEDDEYYQMYLLLNDIMSMTRAKSLPKEAATILSVKVKEHNELYVQLTGDTLKPKHHFLLHYARILAMFGPFALLATIRFEAKHRLLRLTAITCFSRVNLPKTVAIKQQLAFCYRILSNLSIRQPIVPGPSHVVDLKTVNSFSLFSMLLPETVFSETNQCIYNWVECKGTKYVPKQILVTDVDEFDLFIFCEIEFILIVHDEPLFICSQLLSIGYFSEVRAYQVQKIKNCKSWKVVPQSKLLDPYPLSLYTMATGETVVIMKNIL